MSIQYDEIDTFQIATNKNTGVVHAVNVSAKRDILQAAIESLRGDVSDLFNEQMNH